MRIPHVPLISQSTLQQAGLSTQLTDDAFAAEVIRVQLDSSKNIERYQVTVSAQGKQLQLDMDQPLPEGSKVILLPSKTQPPTVQLLAVQPPGTGPVADSEQPLTQLLSQWLASRLPLTSGSGDVSSKAILQAIETLAQDKSTPSAVQQLLQQFLQQRPMLQAASTNLLQTPLHSTAPQTNSTSSLPTAAPTATPTTTQGETAATRSSSVGANGVRQAVAESGLFYEQRLLSLLTPRTDGKLSSQFAQLWQATAAHNSATPGLAANTSATAASLNSVGVNAPSGGPVVGATVGDTGAQTSGISLSPAATSKSVPMSPRAAADGPKGLSEHVVNAKAASTLAGMQTGSTITPPVNTALLNSASSGQQFAATDTDPNAAPGSASRIKQLASEWLSATRAGLQGEPTHASKQTSQASATRTGASSALMQLASKLNQQAQAALSKVQGSDAEEPASPTLSQALLTPSHLLSGDLKASLSRALQLWLQVIQQGGSPEQKPQPAPLPISYNNDGERPEAFRLLQSTLARIETEQFQSLRQDPDNWQLSLPLFMRQGEQLRHLDMELEPPITATGGKRKRGWRVVLHFDLQHLGPLDIEIELNENQVAATFWSQQADTLRSLQQQLPPLRSQLTSLGVEIEVLTARHGQMPAGEHNRIQTRLVDLHT
ncbi:flagellar hook-length control protein FliK [Bacterioplanes sanyensis]|nr:flagellar hook-length control protein FliK [Bacterioplanes sanyensis]